MLLRYLSANVVLVFGLLFPVASRITITAEPSGHVSFHCFTKLWHKDLSVAAWASHIFTQYNRNSLMSINYYQLNLMGRE